jgi:hypothetical protein
MDCTSPGSLGVSFCTVNRNKRSVALDLEDDTAQRQLRSGWVRLSAGGRAENLGRGGASA